MMFANDLTAEERQILDLARLSTGFYGKQFYPGRFTRPYSPHHNTIFDLVDSKVVMPNGQMVPKHNKINIMSFRGGGKSTIAKTIFAKSLRCLDTMFGVYIGKSHDFAALQTESIKRGMVNNHLENHLFGDMTVSTNARIQKEFSKKSWMTNLGALVWPRGCNQPVRGLLYDTPDGASHRPSLIVIDDLMDKQFIGNEHYRDETHDWILTDVSEAVPPPEVSMHWQIIYIDTLKHNDATNERLARDKEWITVRLPLAEVKGGRLVSLAPTMYSDSYVQAKYEAYRQRHKLDLFYQEFMCVAVASEDATFSPKMFRYYDEMSDKFREEILGGMLETVILVDPAKTKKKTSAESAIIGVSVNRVSNKIYVRDIDAGHYHPNELYDRIFKMAERLEPRPHVIGLEMNSLNEFLLHPFLDEMHSRGLHFEVEDLKPRRSPQEMKDQEYGKVGRVGALEPYYRKGAIYHNPRVCADLEAQLLSYPSPQRWDIMDALAYIVPMLQKGLRYFMPPALHDDPYSVGTSEREFRDLEKSYLPPLEGWRSAL